MVLQAVENLAAARSASVTRRRRVSEDSTRGGWWKGVASAFQRRPALAASFGLASGIAIGATIFSLWGPPQTWDTADLTGAMGLSGEGFRPVATRDIDFEGVRGRMEAGVSTGTLAFSLELRSNREIEVTIGFGEGPLRLQGFHQTEPHQGAAILEPGGLRIIHRGENRYVLTRSADAGGSGDVTIRFQVGDRVFEDRLPTIPH